MTPLLVLAEFVFSEAGESAFRDHIERTLAEVRATPGCLQAVMWQRPGRRYQFSTLWDDPEGVGRWVENEFHRSVLMPGFRKWCSEGCFGEYLLQADHDRARKCGACGRWSAGLPGWSEREPSTCAKCGSALFGPADDEPGPVPGGGQRPASPRTSASTSRFRTAPRATSQAPVGQSPLIEASS